MHVRGPNSVGRAVQSDPTLLRSASANTEQKKFWELLVQKSDWFQTPNSMQQGVRTDATCNIQQCWELLAKNVASVCTRLKNSFCFWGTSDARNYRAFPLGM